VARYAEYAKEFGELEEHRGGGGGRLLRRRARLRRAPHRGVKQAKVKFQRVAYRIDPKRFEAASSLLSTPELREIRDKIFDHQEFMESFAGDRAWPACSKA